MTRTRTTRALAAVLAFLLFATLLFAGMPVRAAGELVLKDGASIVYNKDAAVMKADIINALVDKEASGIPEDASLDDFTVEYAFLPLNDAAEALGMDLSLLSRLGVSSLWVTAETGVWNMPGSSLDFFDLSGKIQEKVKDLTGVGFTHIQAGKDQTVRVKYQNGAWVEGKLTVEKANVKVNVRSAMLYFDQVIGENFVTTDPEDDFMIFTFYAGLSLTEELPFVAPTVYFQPPSNKLLDKAMELVIDPAYKALYGKTLTERLNEGTTVGEVRVIADQVIDIVQDASQTALGRMMLEAAGIDVDMINGLVDGMQQISQIADSWRFAIGQPNRAGAYATVAVAINRNYNPGIGAGVLLVKPRLFGVSIQWNDTNANNFVAGQDVNLGATAYYDGKAVDQGVRSGFVGLTEAGSPYYGFDAPTEAGHYLQAAFTFGGNYLAIPAVRILTISAE